MNVKVGDDAGSVLQSGAMWGTFLVRSRSGVAGLLPLRHLGSTDLPRFADDMRLGLHRHLRTQPRRQEPADRPVQVPGGPQQGRLPFEGDGQLRLAVSRADLYADGGASPLAGAQPAQPAGAGVAQA